jgi:hypothetical protein
MLGTLRSCLANKTTANELFENVARLKHLGTTQTKTACMLLRTYCTQVMFAIILSRYFLFLLSKTIPIKIHKTIILPAVLYDFKAWLQNSIGFVLKNRKMRKIYQNRREEIVFPDHKTLFLFMDSSI